MRYGSRRTSKRKPLSLSQYRKVQAAGYKLVKTRSSSSRRGSRRGSRRSTWNPF